MTKEEIGGLSDKTLKSIVATMNPTGQFADQLAWAKQELERRGVDYSDCLGE